MADKGEMTSGRGFRVPLLEVLLVVVVTLFFCRGDEIDEASLKATLMDSCARSLGPSCEGTCELSFGAEGHVECEPRGDAAVLRVRIDEGPDALIGWHCAEYSVHSERATLVPCDGRR